MSAEQRKILEMLAAGSITAEDAERLLNRITESSSSSADQATNAESAGSNEVVVQTLPRAVTRTPLKYLRIVIDSHDGDNVNIRVPLALVRTGIKLTTVMPDHARRRLLEHGVDLSHLSGLEGEDLIEALRELKVDIDSSDGDKVRIFCE